MPQMMLTASAMHLPGIQTVCSRPSRITTARPVAWIPTPGSASPTARRTVVVRTGRDPGIPANPSSQPDVRGTFSATNPSDPSAARPSPGYGGGSAGGPPYSGGSGGGRVRGGGEPSDACCSVNE
eukprot:jgi/Chrzof1/12704/Cz07g04190.t1